MNTNDRREKILEAEEFHEHVMQIAVAKGINIDWLPNGSQHAFSLLHADEISIPPVLCEESYSTAMHEFGHIFGKGQSLGLIACERGAWTWARRNALVWTPKMQTNMDDCMSWYRQRRRVLQPQWKADRRATIAGLISQGLLLPARSPSE